VLVYQEELFFFHDTGIHSIIFASTFHHIFPFVTQKTLNHPNEEINYLASTMNGIVLSHGPNGEAIGQGLHDSHAVLQTRQADYIPVISTLWSLASFAERGGFNRISGVPAFIVEAIGLYSYLDTRR